MINATFEDIDTLARTLFGEAEANNTNDANAIASVIINRVNLPKWPDDIAHVCLQPWQFSCWNSDDPGRARITKVTKSDPWFKICYAIAVRAAAGELKDLTHRSTHYYATYLPKPKWVKKGNKTPVYKVHHKDGSDHLFYNDIDTPPPKTSREALEQARPIGQATTIKAAKVGASAAVSIGAIGETLDHVAPAFSLLETFARYTPWAIALVFAGVIAYLVWLRYQDRSRGVR